MTGLDRLMAASVGIGFGGLSTVVHAYPGFRPDPQGLFVAFLFGLAVGYIGFAVFLLVVGMVRDWWRQANAETDALIADEGLDFDDVMAVARSAGVETRVYDGRRSS